MVRMEVMVPTDAQVSREYSLVVTAASQNQPELKKELTVSVVVVHLDVTLVPTGSLEVNGEVWKEYKTELNTRLNLTATVRNDGTESVSKVNVRFYDNDGLIAERNSSTIAPNKAAVFAIVWTASSVGSHEIRVKIDANNQLGETDESNNDGFVTIDVRASDAGGEESRAAADWTYALGVVAALLVAGAVAYVIIQRRPKVDKELYESIYGKKGEEKPLDAQLAAERAEVERRARERAGEEAGETYEASPAEPPVESAPMEGGAAGAPRLGEALPPIAEQAPHEPSGGASPATPGPEPAPQEPAVVLPPPKKKRITIRPVKEEK